VGITWKSEKTSDTLRGMKDLATPYLIRVYKQQRTLLKRTAKQLKVSEGEVVRRGIEAYCTNIAALKKINSTPSF